MKCLQIFDSRMISMRSSRALWYALFVDFVTLAHDLDFRLLIAYADQMFDPDAHLPRINRGMIYLGACLIAGIRLARERQVNVRVVPTGNAIEESVDLAHEIYNQVFRKLPEKLNGK